MYNKLKLASILFFFMGVISVAQTSRPPEPDRMPPPPPGLPIDNGLFVLLLLGFVYGVYKLYNLSRKMN